MQTLLGVRQAVTGDVQLDARQVVDDVVGRLLQQRLQGLAGLVELAAAALREGQAVAGGVQTRVLVELGAEALGGQARGVLVVQLHAGAHQLVEQAVAASVAGELLGAVAGIGYPQLVDRVGEEEFGRHAGVAVLAHQALEHARHVARVVAGALQVEQADAIRLLLVLPREAALCLDRRRLGRGDGGDPGIAGTRCGGDHAGQQRGHQRHLHALLFFQSAGEVALREVGQFVGQHRGVFALVLRVEQQAGVDADHPAWAARRPELRAVSSTKARRRSSSWLVSARR